MSEAATETPELPSECARELQLAVLMHANAGRHKEDDFAPDVVRLARIARAAGRSGKGRAAPVHRVSGRRG